MAMFFNTNAMNGSNGDFDLASLMAMNIANAEGGAGMQNCEGTTDFDDSCTNGTLTRYKCKPVTNACSCVIYHV